MDIDIKLKFHNLLESIYQEQKKNKKKYPRITTKNKIKPSGKNLEHQNISQPENSKKKQMKKPNLPQFQPDMNSQMMPDNIEEEDDPEFRKLMENPEFKTLLETIGRPVALKPGEKQISDMTIDTFGLPLVSATYAPNGVVLLANAKSNDTILYVISVTQENMPPLIMHQRFSLSPENVISSVAVQNPKSLGIIYAVSGEIHRSSIEFDEMSQPIVTRDPLLIQKAYTSSVQKIVSFRDGSLFFVLSDCSTVVGYNSNGDIVFRTNLGRISDICLSIDYSKLFIASNQQVYAYSIKNGTNISVDLIRTLDVGEMAHSICFLPYTSQLIVGGQSTLVVFHEDVSLNKIVKRISSPKTAKAKPLKVVAPNLHQPYVAALFGKCGLRIYDINAGKVYSELTETHRGEASSVTWSFDGKLILISSKEKPNIELFLFKS